MLDEGAFIVSETDEKGIILFANDYFCQSSGYELSELLGKNHNIVRHSDMPKAAFKDLWETIGKNKVWTGVVKNRRKNGDYYWVYATAYPMVACGTKKTSYMSCRRMATRDEISAAETLYKTLV